MKKNFIILLLIFICLFAFAETRTALVIGNGDYNSSPLNNPENDARDMADKLEDLGFDVTLEIDCTLSEMTAAIRDFGSDLLGGGVGLFYYSGHAVQVDGNNYLIPIDSNIQDEDEVEFYAVDAGLVLNKMATAKNTLNIVILDSCRDNPFSGNFRSTERGLSIVAAPSETLIVYATAPGSVASDGSGRNGTFTENLLEYISIPGLEVGDMLRNVKREVSEETNGAQRPWSTDDLTGEFYFAGAEGNPEDYLPAETNTTVISDDLVFVEGGNFSMGSNDGDDDEQPIHTVKITSFYMGKYEVTNQEVADVFTHGIESGALFVDATTVKNNYGNKQELLDLDDDECQIVYSRGRLAVQPGKENNPVIEISWYGALVFCNLLSEIRGYDPAYDLSDWSCDFTVNGYRLPTEAEWEYAAKGGNNHDSYTYSGSNTAGDVGWYSGNSGSETHPVGGKSPNSLGLYDMSGNVFEWCWDWYGGDYYSNTSLVDPEGPGSGSYRVLRGGSWYGNTDDLRFAYRVRCDPTDSNYDDGFRVVVSSF